MADLDDEIPEIRIYVLLAAARSYGGVYGVGVTVTAAERACVGASTTLAKARKGKMLKLPLGVTHFAVDCFGTAHWRVAGWGTTREPGMGLGVTAAEMLKWSPEEKDWVKVDNKAKVDR